MGMILKITHLLTMIALLTVMKSQTLTPSNYSVSPNYAKSSSSQYIFNFNAVTPFTLNYDVRVYFPQQYTITTVSNCQFLLNNNPVSSAVCSVNTTTNEIVFSQLNIASPTSSIRLQFSTSTARYSGTSTLIFYFYNLTNQSPISSLTNYVSLSIVNAVMACGVSSTSNIVGDNITYTLSYTPIVPIQANSVLQVQMQPWGAYSQSNFITTNVSSICSGNCTLNLPSSNGNLTELLVYSSLFSADTSSAGSLVLSRARNPASTNTITISIVILAKISTFSTNAYMNCTSTFSVSTPNSFKLLNFATSNTNISASNIITLRLQVTNPISSISYLRIQASILSLSFQLNNYNIGTQPFLSATSDGSILLGNLTTSTTASPSILTLNNFTLFNPPYANKPVSITFSTENLVDGVYYLVDRGTADIISTPSTITQFGITVANTSINAVTTYSIWFKNINRYIKSSFIIVNFPSTINIAGSTCSFSDSTCTVMNSTSLRVTINTIMSVGNNLTLVISSVNNPGTTTTTDSIAIYTYYEDSLSLVDQLTAGLTVTATSVPLRSVVLTPSSTVVGQTGSYTVNVQIANKLPSPAIMKIKIPTSSFPTTTVVLGSLTIGSTVVSTCSITTISPLYIQLQPSCFPSTIQALTTIKIVLNNITNPISTKPSASWQIQTLYNSLQMQYLTSQIKATMIVPAQITQFIATPASQIVNAQTTYSMSLTFLYPHYSGDRILVSFPNGVILLGSGFQCTSSSSGVTVSCFQVSTTLLQVTISTASSSISALNFSVTSITNNWYASTSTLSIQTATNDSTKYFYVQSGQSTVNFLPSTLTASALSNQQIILLGQSTVKLTITSPFVLSRATNQALLLLQIIVPLDLTPVAGTCTLSYSSATCVMSNQNINITGFGDFSSNLTVSFKSATSYFVNSSQFISQLSYNSSTIASNSDTRLSSYCSLPCKQCTSVPTQCISCLPSPYTLNNTYLSVNSTCVAVCPPTYFASSGSCLQCNQSACYQCVGNLNNCTSCPTGKYLYASTCLSACPSQYYALNGTCIACVAPCFTCLNSTSCLSCISNYFLDINTKCVTTCSNISYIGLNGTCQLCQNNCLTCSRTLTNCTSCPSQYLLFNNECVRACQSGYYNSINSTCQQCKSPCATCSSLTICQSCVANYYLYNNKTCTQSCPNGTLAIVNVCQPCNANCATCSSTLTYCTSCPSDKLLYFHQCLTDCPQLTYPYNRTCTTCITPCLTCASNPNLCLSCVGDLLLLNQTCVALCPENGYYNSGSTCLPCTQNCLTCKSLASCDLCSNNYYLLSGGCVEQCPDSHPIIQNRQCTPCSEQCATCFGSATNCTTCTVYYFKYSYTCVLECPLTYYSNVVTYECEDGLSTRIVFFPILITSLVIIVIIIISKWFARETSLITAITAFMSPLQMIIWAYVFSLLFYPIKQPGITYAIPIALLAFSFFSFAFLAVVFFIVNNKRLTSDDYVIQWSTNNVNYAVCQIVRLFSLVLGAKFFRIIYSRIFNTITLSMAYKNRSNAFTLATIFSFCSLIFCEIPAITACWFLVYNKTLKDQIFYSCIQALIVTFIAILFELMDIYKPQHYFDQSEFCKIKKYVQKIKDISTMNKLEEGFEVSHEEGSVDAQRFVGSSGGKLFYTKQKPEDIKDDVYFQDDKSEITDAVEKNKKKGKIINIFAPILQQDAQYYENEKYPVEAVKTQLQLEQMKRKIKSIGSDDEQQMQDIVKRRQQMGLDQNFDDCKSLINERQRKQKWNNIIDKRKQLAQRIFNKHPPNLQQIDEPEAEDLDENQHEDSTAKIIRHLEYDEPGMYETMNSNQMHSNLKKRKKKKKMKVNKQLQEIYLQRLTQKKNKSMKDMLASDKLFKYDKYDF